MATSTRYTPVSLNTKCSKYSFITAVFWLPSTTMVCCINLLKYSLPLKLIYLLKHEKDQKNVLAQFSDILKLVCSRFSNEKWEFRWRHLPKVASTTSTNQLLPHKYRCHGFNKKGVASFVDRQSRCQHGKRVEAALCSHFDCVTSNCKPREEVGVQRKA